MNHEEREREREKKSKKIGETTIRDTWCTGRKRENASVCVEVCNRALLGPGNGVGTESLVVHSHEEQRVVGQDWCAVGGLFVAKSDKLCQYIRRFT